MKAMDRQREEQRRVTMAQQVEQQRLYKQDLQHSYKSMLDNQLGQQRMQKEIDMQDKMHQMMAAKQREDMMRAQASQMRNLKH